MNSYNDNKKIKVLHLASNPEWAGAEVHLATLADSLKSDERVDVSVCVFHDGKVVDYLKRRGIEVKVVELKRLFDMSTIFKVAYILKSKDIDILHTHGYKANVIGALAARLHKHTKCIRTEHGSTEPFFGFDKIKMNFYEYLDYLTGRFFTKKIISVSFDIAKNAVSKYSPDKISTIHNGIDISENEKINNRDLKKELGIADNAFVIGIVGRLVPVKGHEYFIEAARLILEKRQDVRFLIVGDGPLRQALESRALALLANHLIFTGFRNDVKDIIRIMDIVVFSSISEGIPYTLLEAMLARRAIVAARVGGLAEVISDGKNGLLVKSRDIKDMAEKCLYLLQDRMFARGMGEEAEKTVKECFSADRMKEDTIRVYEEALS